MIVDNTSFVDLKCRQLGPAWHLQRFTVACLESSLNSLRCCWWGLLPVWVPVEASLEWEVCEKWLPQAHNVPPQREYTFHWVRAHSAWPESPCKKGFCSSCIYSDQWKLICLLNLFFKIKGKPLYLTVFAECKSIDCGICWSCLLAALGKWMSHFH